MKLKVRIKIKRLKKVKNKACGIYTPDNTCNCKYKLTDILLIYSNCCDKSLSKNINIFYHDTSNPCILEKKTTKIITKYSYLHSTCSKFQSNHALYILTFHFNLRFLTVCVRRQWHWSQICTFKLQLLHSIQIYRNLLWWSACQWKYDKEKYI